MIGVLGRVDIKVIWSFAPKSRFAPTLVRPCHVKSMNISLWTDLWNFFLRTSLPIQYLDCNYFTLVTKKCNKSTKCAYAITELGLYISQRSFQKLVVFFITRSQAFHIIYTYIVSMCIKPDTGIRRRFLLATSATSDYQYGPDRHTGHPTAIPTSWSDLPTANVNIRHCDVTHSNSVQPGVARDR